MGAVLLLTCIWFSAFAVLLQLGAAFGMISQHFATGLTWVCCIVSLATCAVQAINEASNREMLRRARRGGA